VRKTWLLNLLLMAAVAVFGSRTWTALQQPPPALPKPSAAARAPVPSPQPAAPGEGEAGGAARETYDEIVARDLFSAMRGVIPPAPKPVTETRPAPKQQPPPKVTLYGVVILDGEKSAFLAEGTQDAKPRKVREGESFAGGKVTAIRADGVTLQFAGNEVSVPLRTPKEGGAAAAPPRPGEQAPPAVAPPAAQEGLSRQIRPPGARYPESLRPPGQQAPPRQTAPRFVPAPPVEEPIPDEELFPEDEGGIDEFDEGAGGELLDEEMQESP
jgi:hypothetical protein